MYIFFHHKNDGGEMPGTKNDATVALSNVRNPS